MAMQCDVCNSDLDPAAGYILPNRSIAISQGYWEHHIRSNYSTFWKPFQFSEDQILGAFSQSLKMRADDKTAWAVCEGCSEYFIFDRGEARAHALNGTRPARKENRVKPGEFVLFAAAGFERVLGYWPANVRPVPAQAGACGFCEKRIYEPEPVNFIDAVTLARHQAAGLLNAPVGAPEVSGGVERWVLCMPCLALLAAKKSRKDEGAL
jgi:hypothetical protein